MLRKGLRNKGSAPEPRTEKFSRAVLSHRKFRFTALIFRFFAYSGYAVLRTIVDAPFATKFIENSRDSHPFIRTRRIHMCILSFSHFTLSSAISLTLLSLLSSCFFFFFSFSPASLPLVSSLSCYVRNDEDWGLGWGFGEGAFRNSYI